MTSINQIILSFKNSQSVEEYSRDKRPKNLSQEAWDREAPEQIDGATIHVRGADEYVMIVMLDEPQIFAAGEERRTAGWTAVPVSSEMTRRIAPLLGLRPNTLALQ